MIPPFIAGHTAILAGACDSPLCRRCQPSVDVELGLESADSVQGGAMTLPQPRQLRLIIETDDFDEAVRFYRDVLGMPEQPAFATTGDDRVSNLHAGVATIELATTAHSRAVDAMENAPATDGPTLRIALEVADTEKAVALSEESGREVLARPTETPFRTINARVQGPAGWQVTFFQELETLEQRQGRAGFETDDRRAR
ncbi:VOC family protein [Microbacterium sp. 1P10UB]|uniref:VOC family protein n=1 Tax=unclassified Microbacterium TaxID=2609290 RepID=UPI0039A2B99A